MVLIGGITEVVPINIASEWLVIVVGWRNGSEECLIYNTALLAMILTMTML